MIRDSSSPSSTQARRASAQRPPSVSAPLRRRHSHGLAQGLPDGEGTLAWSSEISARRFSDDHVARGVPHVLPKVAPRQPSAQGTLLHRLSWLKGGDASKRPGAPARARGQAPDGMVLPAAPGSPPPQGQDARSELAVAAVEGCLAWCLALLRPVELARLGAAASPLSAAVAEACAHQLRSARLMLLVPGGSSRLARGERTLHRAQRQCIARRPTCTASENYSAAIDGKGRLLIWGRPGWLEARTAEVDAHAEADWPALQPRVAVLVVGGEGETPCSGPGSEVKQVAIATLAASRHAVFALTSGGQLLYAQVRRKPNLVIHDVELHPLKELDGITVAQISTRFGQAFAVTSDGSVYAWGMKSGDPGRPEHSCSMGFGEITTLLHPSPLPGFGSGAGQTPVRFVATGVSHTIFVTVFGEVFTVGQADSGKLGLGQSPVSSEQVLKPTKVHFDARPAPAIVAAAAGARHSLFLASNGEVWGCGFAKAGALPTTARPDHKHCLWTPRHLDRLQSFCTSLAAGISLSFFVGECGEVYFSGTARQTPWPFGREPHADPSVPVRVPGLRQIEQVSVSLELSFYQWEHAIFVRQDGALFAWGHMGHGEFRPKGRTGDTGFAARLRSGAAPGFCNRAVPIDHWPGVPGGL